MIARTTSINGGGNVGPLVTMAILPSNQCKYMLSPLGTHLLVIGMKMGVGNIRKIVEFGSEDGICMSARFDGVLTALYIYTQTCEIDWQKGSAAHFQFMIYPLSSCVLLGQVCVVSILASLDACHEVPSRC